MINPSAVHMESPTNIDHVTAQESRYLKETAQIKRPINITNHLDVKEFLEKPDIKNKTAFEELIFALKNNNKLITENRGNFSITINGYICEISVYPDEESYEKSENKHDHSVYFKTDTLCTRKFVESIVHEYERNYSKEQPELNELNELNELKANVYVLNETNTNSFINIVNRFKLSDELKNSREEGQNTVAVNPNPNPNPGQMDLSVVAIVEPIDSILNDSTKSQNQQMKSKKREDNIVPRNSGIDMNSTSTPLTTPGM